MKLPPFNSYWVVPDVFLAGEYPSTNYFPLQNERRLDAMIEAGITTFIDLTEPHERVPYAPVLHERAGYYQVEVKHQRFSIGDFGVPSHALMRQILATIEETIASGGKPYVHCGAGLGRTGTVAASFFVENGTEGEKALKKVQSLCYYGKSPQTETQRRFVREWR